VIPGLSIEEQRKLLHPYKDFDKYGKILPAYVISEVATMIRMLKVNHVLSKVYKVKSFPPLRKNQFWKHILKIRNDIPSNLDVILSYHQLYDIWT